MDYEAVRMNADGLHLSRFSNGPIESLNHIAKDLKKNEISFKKGSKGNFHKHEHLQITYIAKGSFEFTIGGETKIVNQGDSVYMPSNVEHGVTALEDGILVDVFNPMRKDFLK